MNQTRPSAGFFFGAAMVQAAMVQGKVHGFRHGFSHRRMGTSTVANVVANVVARLRRSANGGNATCCRKATLRCRERNGEVATKFNPLLPAVARSR